MVCRTGASVLVSLRRGKDVVDFVTDHAAESVSVFQVDLFFLFFIAWIRFLFFQTGLATALERRLFHVSTRAVSSGLLVLVVCGKAGPITNLPGLMFLITWQHASPSGIDSRWKGRSYN